MCVRRRWRGEGELGCDRVVFTHLLDFLEGVEKEDQRKNLAGAKVTALSSRC